MGDFFNKYFNIRHILEKKREYKRQAARITALPEDYQYALRRIQEYMWLFVSVDGYDVYDAQDGILELFEDGAAHGKSVLEVTGPDVAGFADELMKNAAIDRRRRKLNEDITRHAAK